MEYIRDAIAHLTKEISICAKQVGRDPEDITLMAVSKHQPLEKIIYAREECDIHCFGENRVQELNEKFVTYPMSEEIHMIGHLQSNKVKKVVDRVEWIDSIDSLKLLEKIEKALQPTEKVIKVLFEYNTSGEETKSGFTSKEELFKTVEACFKMKHIEMRGLMTIGPLGGDEKALRVAFTQLRELYYETIKCYPEIQFDTISMGMSSDYKLAIEEGSTMIRVGTGIFGKRDYA